MREPIKVQIISEHGEGTIQQMGEQVSKHIEGRETNGPHVISHTVSIIFEADVSPKLRIGREKSEEIPEVFAKEQKS